QQSSTRASGYGTGLSASGHPRRGSKRRSRPQLLSPQAMDGCCAVARDLVVWSRMSGRLLVNLRFALRLVRRSPLFATVLVLVLGLTIGANPAAFGLIDALLLKPLPVQAPEQLVRIVGSPPDGGISYPDYLDYRAGISSLHGLLAFTATTVGLTL